MNLHKSSKFDKVMIYPAVIDLLGRFNLEVQVDALSDLFIIPQNCHVTPDSNQDNVIREDIVIER